MRPRLRGGPLEDAATPTPDGAADPRDRGEPPGVAAVRSGTNRQARLRHKPVRHVCKHNNENTFDNEESQHLERRLAHVLVEHPSVLVCGARGLLGILRRPFKPVTASAVVQFFLGGDPVPLPPPYCNQARPEFRCALSLTLFSRSIRVIFAPPAEFLTGFAKSLLPSRHLHRSGVLPPIHPPQVSPLCAPVFSLAHSLVPLLENFPVPPPAGPVFTMDHRAH